MKISFAPLEGITNYYYRIVHQRHFGGVDDYYTPFLSVNQNHQFKNKEKKEIDPDNNQNITLIPQLLSNKSEQLIWGMSEIARYGYETVNLNVGCPAKTVITKKKGAGLLGYLDLLDQMLNETFEAHPPVQLSIKTRIGLNDANQLKEIIDIYNRYPISELIVHPRIQTQMYKGIPDLEAFAYVLEHSVHPVIYNGNIFTVDDYKNLISQFPELDHIMLGRGLIANPGLAREIKTGQRITVEELKSFHDDLLEIYQQHISGDRNVLFKLKELWFYMGTLFDAPKVLKKIRKAQTIEKYQLAVNELWTYKILDDRQRKINI